jgi:hypothetical protein
MKNLSKNKSCIGCIALHGMAYYIFLKSLRSLEEFRKNPHVKILAKSPCANFQSLGEFKIQILIQKSFFFSFGPATLTGPLGLRPSRPRWPLSSRGPNSTLPAQLAHVSVAYLRKYVFPFGSRLPSWLPPSRLSVKWDLAVGFVLSPALSDPGRVTADFHRAAAPRAARSPSRMPPSYYRPPITSPSSNHALTRRNEPNYSAIEAPLLAGRYSPAFAPRAAPAPYKRRAPPLGFTAPLPASLLFSPRLSIALTEHRRRRFYTTVARPPRRSSTSGEALDRTLSNSSSFPCSRGELSWTGAPVGRAPVSSSGRRQRPVHGGPELRWSTDSWTRSMGFPLGKQFPENPILDILHLGPSVSLKLTRIPRTYN